jgi:putative chitinase
MIQVDAKLLRVVAPECYNTGLWVDVLQFAMDEYGITNNADRVAAFLAHVAVESAGFNKVRENLNFTTAERICQVWPTRFPTLESAMPYVRNEMALGNKVYAGRIGNGSEQSGDGYRFRGGGLIQITGRLNYSVLEAALEKPFVHNPDLLARPDNAAMTAAFFWKSHGLNELADAIPGVPEDEDFLRETKIINGGTTGFPDRLARFKRTRAALA